MSFLKARLQKLAIVGMEKKISVETDPDLKNILIKMKECIEQDRPDQEYNEWQNKYVLRQAEMIKEQMEKAKQKRSG